MRLVESRRYNITTSKTRRTCASTGKVCHQTKKAAQGAVSLLKKRARKKLQAYKCPYCCKWHLTSHATTTFSKNTPLRNGIDTDMFEFNIPVFINELETRLLEIVRTWKQTPSS